MEHNSGEAYNFQYLMRLYDGDSRDFSRAQKYELDKIIDRLDECVDADETHYKRLFHIVPVLYTMAFIIGSCSYIYILISP